VKLKYTDKKHEAGNVWSFFFEPQEPIAWRAGQSIRLELPRATYGADEKRFSISAAPFEKIIRITTRLSGSSFKKSLSKLKQNQMIDAFSVEGDFLWEQKPKIFIAAGIGITPFRSMLIQAKHEKKPIDTVLIYGSSDPEPVFKVELQELSDHSPSYRFLFISRRVSPADVLSVNNWQQHLVYISGPEPMVNETASKLIAAGLAESQLKLDLFTGYN